MDSTLDSLRVPPHSIEAEQAVLGGLLLDNQAVGQDRRFDRRFCIFIER
ncbi:protein containing DNA helicase, DnaB-like protein, partial [mine drainage metagenome]